MIRDREGKPLPIGIYKNNILTEPSSVQAVLRRIKWQQPTSLRNAKRTERNLNVSIAKIDKEGLLEARSRSESNKKKKIICSRDKSNDTVVSINSVLISFLSLLTAPWS